LRSRGRSFYALGTMKRRRFLGVAGPALTGTVAATLLPRAVEAGATPEGALEKAVLALERRWMEAMVHKDEATLRSLMAEDFKRVEKPWPNFGMAKPQWLGNAMRLYQIESFKLDSQGTPPS